MAAHEKHRAAYHDCLRTLAAAYDTSGYDRHSQEPSVVIDVSDLGLQSESTEVAIPDAVVRLPSSVAVTPGQSLEDAAGNHGSTHANGSVNDDDDRGLDGDSDDDGDGDGGVVGGRNAGSAAAADLSRGRDGEGWHHGQAVALQQLDDGADDDDGRAQVKAWRAVIPRSRLRSREVRSLKRKVLAAKRVLKAEEAELRRLRQEEADVRGWRGKGGWNDRVWER